VWHRAMFEHLQRGWGAPTSNSVWLAFSLFQLWSIKSREDSLNKIQGGHNLHSFLPMSDQWLQFTWMRLCIAHTAEIEYFTVFLCEKWLCSSCQVE
jgi:hypothetical protein